MYIVYAPEAASEALARTLSDVGGIGCGPAEAALPAGERALVLVTPDYYSRGFWRMKQRLTAQAVRLEGMLCACLVQSDSEIGADLAIRALVSQLLAAGAAVYLCAMTHAGGRILPGGCTEPCKNEMTTLDFYTKFLQMAEKLG